MKKTLFSMFAILACVCSFVACGNDDEEKKDDISIVGLWQIDSTAIIKVVPADSTDIFAARMTDQIAKTIESVISSFEFTADRKVEKNPFIASYNIDGNKLTLELAEETQQILGKSMECNYTLDANMLSLSISDLKASMPIPMPGAQGTMDFIISISANYNRVTNWPY